MAERVHATALALGRRGVLLRGPSGAGKSDLALRCIAMPASPLLAAGFQLVADDQVMLEFRDGALMAEAPKALAGLLEVRGIGIVSVAFAATVEIVLVVDLVNQADVERLPSTDRVTRIAGASRPIRLLWPFEASAPLKLGLALTSIVVP